MSGALKYESFCVEPSERWMFAGNASGQICIVDIDRFSVIEKVQAHTGSVQAITAHRALPYVASLSTDRTVTVWKRDEGSLSQVCVIPIRDIRASNDVDDVPLVQSTSQAIGFHDRERRIVTRTGNAALVELEFDDIGGYGVRWCRRLHGDADLISARFAHDSDQVLSGSIDGQFILSVAGNKLRSWQIGKSGNVHWAEHLGGTTYLLASDMRAVARIDLTKDEPVIIGEPFTRDDLEHVTYNATSGRAFVASFDRTIYEIDPQTCEPLRTAYEPPFKCRWVKTLERAPSTLLVQCRNGGLYKADADTGDVVGEIKETPEALWTAVHLLNGALVFAGEGHRLLHLQPKGLDLASREVRFHPSWLPLETARGSYTKRMVRQGSSGRLVIGRTNGDVIVVDTDAAGRLGAARLLTKLPAAIRDLAVAPAGTGLFAACEDGQVRKVDLDTGATIVSWQSPVGQPIWALAHNAARGLVAASERGGNMVILDDDDFTVLHNATETGRPKRMKFAGEDTLIYNKLDQLYRMDLNTAVSALLVDSQGNTIEDFVWDRQRRYLLLVGYMQNIVLCDFETGAVINTSPDQIDYSKGIIFVDQQNEVGHYPLDFLTFGRSGTAHYFRVHDEKILALGPVCRPRSAAA
jgi:WD40 repeat protein